MIYGYCRISMKQQSIDRQIRNIKAMFPDAVIVTEEYGGTTLDRPAWRKLVSRLKAGDTVVFDSVSRMSRDAEEGSKLYLELYERGVELVFLRERYIDMATYKKALAGKVELTGDKIDYVLEGVNKYLLALAEEQIRIAFEQAEKEVQDLRQRTREGIETARLAGKQIGQERGRKLNVKKAAAAKEVILKHSKDFNGTLDDADVIKLAEVSRNSYYKYKRELR